MDSTMLGTMSNEELVAEVLRERAEKAVAQAENIALRSENIALMVKSGELEARHLATLEALAKLQRHVFGEKSERFVPGDPNQLQLDLGVAMETAGKDAEQERIEYTREKNKKRKETPVREALPPDIPRVVVEIEPGVDTTGMRYIGDEVTEELGYKAASWFVTQSRRKKYIATGTDEKTTVVCGRLPSRPIVRGSQARPCWPSSSPRSSSGTSPSTDNAGASPAGESGSRPRPWGTGPCDVAGCSGSSTRNLRNGCSQAVTSKRTRPT